MNIACDMPRLMVTRMSMMAKNLEHDSVGANIGKITRSGPREKFNLECKMLNKTVFVKEVFLP